MHDYLLRVRPKRSLSTTAIITFFALTIPVFAVLYWYTAPLHAVRWVLGAHIVIALLCLVTLFRQSTVFAALTKDQLVGNGIFSPTVSVPRSRIRSVALAQVYGRESSEISTQFAALDDKGNCVFRMRGEFWHDDDLRTLATALNVGKVEETPPLSREEFYAKYQGSRYWFERKK
jgi:hypothetical protein